MENNIKLKPRLLCAASMVKKGKRIADIGTDHAYLPIWLAQNNIIEHAIASDIRKGPYLSALENIKKYGVDSIVEARLGAGLETVSQGQADCIVICGMGGELMVEILRACPFVRELGMELVLQPMTHAEILRKYLYDSGFEITLEKAVYDSRHYYTVISAEYTGLKKDMGDAFYYMGLLDTSDPMAKKYLGTNLRHIKNRAGGLQLSGDAENANRLLAVCNAISLSIESEE
ncbi:MAG: SAM-dependent methyltransferase [Clostridia bacterium]|nr:SAM-dependent methyltransferase [Clostridia bacterium]